MFTSKLYRLLSILIAFCLLLNATPLFTASSAVAAPLESEASAPFAQGAVFDVSVAIRNRDGTPLSGVNITLTAYDGPYSGQAPVYSSTIATGGAGKILWPFSSPALTSTATIRIEQVVPTDYVFSQAHGLPAQGMLDGEVIQINNVTPGAPVDAGVFVDKRKDSFEFQGTVLDAATNKPLEHANVIVAYTTATGVNGAFNFVSQAGWVFRETDHPVLSQYDVVTFTIEATRTEYLLDTYDYPSAQLTGPSIGVVDNGKIRYQGILGGTYDGNNLFLTKDHCRLPTVETEHFRIYSCPIPTHPNFTDVTKTDAISNALEYAYTKLVGDFREPARQAGEAKVIVNVEHGNFDVCGFQIGPTSILGNAGGIGLPGQIWIRNDLWINPGEGVDATGVWQNPGYMTVIAAHELFHLIQWNYLGYDQLGECSDILPAYLNQYANIYGWWMEANSAWIQYQLHRTNNDYIEAIKKQFLSSPNLPLTLKNGGHEYGASLFPLYLSEKVGSYPETIHNLWQTHAGEHTDFVDTIGTAVPGGWLQVFPDFATANFVLDEPNIGYSNGITLTANGAAVNVDPLHVRKSLQINDTDTVDGGIVHPLGASYAVFTATNLASGVVLSLTVDSVAITNIGSCITEQKARLLVFNSGALTPTIVDVPAVMSSDTFGTKYRAEAEVADFGSQVDKVVLIEMAIPQPGSCQGDRTQYVSKYTYTYKVLAENKPPEIRLEAMPPGGGLCSQPMPFKLIAVDNESGLDWVKTSNPVHVTNTLNYTAGQIYSTTLFTLDPGESRIVTLEAGDRAGNSVQRTQTATNPGGGPGCGGGNPDDNFSAASARVAPISLPAAAPVVPRIAVLGGGFSAFATQFLAWGGEPSGVVDSDFDPAQTLADYPILVIPSGGLIHLSSSASFRARLEEYARRGGVIIALDQQRGSAYEALPGGQLTGYGWDQDLSCYVNAFFLSASHPILSGFNKPRLDVHADGYFTAWPADATILLRRSANGQPGGVLYPFGDGWVFATTMYDDWGLAYGQYAEDARVLMRGVIAWARHQGNVPQYHPGETVTFSIPITNTSPFTVSEVQLALITPARIYTATQTVPTNLAPGQTAMVPFTTTAALPLGFWEVQVTGGTTLYPVHEVSAFSVSNPPASVAPDTDLSLSVNAPASTFVKSTEATFTFHVFNHTSSTRTATVRYGLPHHTWETGNVALYGEKDRLSQILTVPAQGEASFEWTVPLFVNQDTVWARIENGVGTWFNLQTITPRVDLSMALSERPYFSGRPVTATLTITNHSPISFTPDLAVQANQSAGRYLGRSLLYQSTPFPLPAAPEFGETVITTTFIFTPVNLSQYSYVPSGQVQLGSASAWLRKLNLGLSASASTNFQLADGRLRLSAQPIGPWLPGETGTVSVTVLNTEPTLAAAGFLTATLLSPWPTQATSVTQVLEIPAGETSQINVALPIPLEVRKGDYQLRLQAWDGYSVVQYVMYPYADQYSLPASFDRPAYRAGDTAQLRLPIENWGLFQADVTAEVHVLGTPLSQTQTVSLPTNQRTTLTITMSLPADLSAGTYPVEVIYRNSGGDTWSDRTNLYVTLPDLRAAIGAADAQAGGALTITVMNAGGASASGNYDLALYDPRGQVVAQTNGDFTTIGAGESQTIRLEVPGGLSSGQYAVRGYLHEAQTDRYQNVIWPVDVIGLGIDLSIAPDREIFGLNQPITLTAILTNTGQALMGAQLDVRVTQPASALHWETFRRPTDPVPNNFFNDLANDLAFDAQGHLWMATYDYGGAGVLDDNHTPFDKSDDRWQTFTADDGLSHNELTQLAIDHQGRKWFGTWHHGVNLLDDHGTPFDKSDDEWARFDVSDDPVQDSVGDVAPDAQDRLWLTTNFGVRVLDLNGTPFDPTDDITQTFTTADGLNDSPLDIAIDQTGLKWIGLYYGGVSLLDDGGTLLDKSDDRWLTFTGDDGLAHGLVWRVLIDAHGDKWFASEGGISVLDDNGTPFDKSDDRWQSFTQTEGMLSNATRTVWIDALGRKWIGSINGGVSILDDNGTPFDKSDDLWETYTPADGLASPHVHAIIAGNSAGVVWIGTENGLNVVDRITDDTTGGYWQTRVPIDLSAAESTTVVLPTGLLTPHGKFRVEARLTAGDGQALATSQQAFYRFPNIDTVAGYWRPAGLAMPSRQATTTDPIAVTLNADPLVARPGQSISVTGVVQNFGTESADRLLSLYQDGVEVQTVGPFTVEAGEVYPFTVIVTAPSTAGLSLLEARSSMVDGDQVVAVQEVVRVAQPVVSTEIQAPPIVGREPFMISVVLNNTGSVDAQLDVTLGDQSQAIHLPAGQVKVIQFQAQTEHDTTYTIVLSGDVDQAFDQYVSFSENIMATFTPRPVYPAGRVELPYQFLNVGLRAAEFNTVITLTDASAMVQSQVLPVFTPEGATITGSLVFDNLPVGDYTLTYQTPYQAEPQSVAFQVGPSNLIDLSLETGEHTGALLTATATLTNAGANTVDGTVVLYGDLGTEAVSVTVEPDAVFVYPFSLDLANALQGPQVITTTFYTHAGQALSTASTPVTVGGPNIVLVSIPDNAALTTGQMQSLSFVVENQGDQAGLVELALATTDLVNDYQSVWLEAGEQQSIDFDFFVPGDLTSGPQIATYILTNKSAALQPVTGNLPFNLIGTDVTVEATTNAPYYEAGAVAAVTISVTNRNASVVPALYALVRFNGTVITQQLNFSSSTAAATFEIPARFDGDAKVFYGVYQQDTDRAVHLNTLYLVEYDPLLMLLTDKQVYQPGEPVEVTVISTVAGQLAIEAPGYTDNVQLPASGFSFTLPSSMARGTYAVRYTLSGCNCPLEGRALIRPFDVDAVQVKVTDARVTLSPTETQPQWATLQLQIGSSAPLNAVLHTWINAGDGQPHSSNEQPVSLAAVPYNEVSLPVPLADLSLGTHDVVYRLVDSAHPDLVYAIGSVPIDLGGLTLLSAHLDHEEYAYTTDPVVVETTLNANALIEAHLSIELDGVSTQDESLTLASGVHRINRTLPGSVQPGWHELSIKLEANGLTTTTSLRFAYGTQAADLTVSQSRLAVATSGVTGTLHIFVRNTGGEDAPATTLQMWDGDPAAGGQLINQVATPALKAGEGAWLQTTWDLRQRGGLHTVVAIVDALNQVAEFYEDNNRAGSEVEVPGFAVQVSAEQALYNPGQTVAIMVQAINLRSDQDVSLTLTTTAEYESALPVFDDVQPLFVPAGATVSMTVPWNIGSALGGQYGLRAVAQAGEEEHAALTTVRVRDSANFIASPLNGSAPLTVTFNDLSTPFGGIETWSWDFGDGTTSSEQNPVHYYSEAGAYTVALTVTTGSDIYTKVHPTYIVVESAGTPPNQPPVVEVGADRTVAEGEWLSFTGTFTDPDSLDAHAIEWDFGDGITLTGTLTPTHLYADNGIYLVTLAVTDSAGGVGQGTLHVTVNNAPPQVNAGVNQTVLEGDAVLFNGTFTDLGAIDTHTIQWTFGDGATTSGVLTPTHVYADNGVYTTTLTITDKDGGSGMSTVLVTVNNAPPTVDAGPDQTVARGHVAYFNGLFTDPCTADTHTIAWNFGDGTTGQGTVAPTHVYAHSGIYTATLTITDDDGGVGSDSLVITVQAIVPTVNAGSDQSAAEGEAMNFTGAISGTGSLSGYTFAWNFGDGATANGTLTPTHTYADNGVYTVILNVTDDEGRGSSDTLIVTVSNVAPTVNAGPDQTTVESATVSFNGSFTDPGVLDTYTYHWNFGDGLTANGALTASHIYTRSGIYTVTLTVTDDDGGVGGDTLRVTVATQPTTCALYPIALHVNTVLSATVGQTLPDIYNGAEQGNFGWLSWTGANGEPALVNSLTPPGDSHTYINPNNPNDHTVSINDWVFGRPGVANSSAVRNALDVLKTLTIVLPVWDTATGQGSNTQYHVVGFARIQITDYQLPGQDRITAIYRGPATCQ